MIYLSDCTGLDLSLHPLSRLASKKAIAVEVAFAVDSGWQRTIEGPVPYKRGDAIVTGPSGDKWPIRRAFFDDFYSPCPPVERGNNGRYLKKANAVQVLRVFSNFYVRTGGFTLLGRRGDWLVQYTPRDYGIVSAAVFKATYKFCDYYTARGRTALAIAYQRGRRIRQEGNHAVVIFEGFEI